MVTELAHIDITPGHEADFEAGVAAARPLFLRAAGCLGMELLRGVAHPSSYRLVVKWARLEDHTVTFRNSADFAEWRRLAAPYFASAPVVVHLESCRLE
jgi:heme-degrading monooxygenase HmoA